VTGALAAVWAWWQGQWPGVYPNLIAAGIQGGAVGLWARVHLRKLRDSNRRLHESNARLHHRLEQLHNHITTTEGGAHEPHGH
jgi:hypothetical protein